MAWVQVHESLPRGLKLRRLARILKCSRAEAIGILLCLWFFTVHSGDENGLIECVDPEDICNDPPKGNTSEQVTEALIQAGFLERGKEVDSFIVHNWSYWQSVWIAEKRRRDEKARYMREYRERERAEEE